MIYLIKDPKGNNIFENPSSQVNSHVNSALGHNFKEQQNCQTLSTLPSTSGKEEEVLEDNNSHMEKTIHHMEETIRHMEETIREKERVITEQQCAQDAASNVSCTEIKPNLKH